MPLRYLLWLLLILSPCFSFAEVQRDTISDKIYPKNYFHSPLKIPLRIISNFGAFRDNHFHSGLDLSTQGKTGLQVIASADGYISRIKIQSGGYGKVLYITHPNGFVTVYAHLKRFVPKIEEWIEKIQYKAQVYELDIHPDPKELPVLQGEWIAFSGNTGNSGGPHLHFEIRDEKTEDIINPLAFGLPITDHKPPIIKAVVIYRQDINPVSHVNGMDFMAPTFKKISIIPVRFLSGSYRLIKPLILHTGEFYYLGLISGDYSDVSASEGNPYRIELRDENTLAYSSTLLRFGFDQTRSINSFLDYSSFKFEHQKIERSYIDPGNPLKIYYPATVSDKIIQKNEGNRQFEYRVEDIFGNLAKLPLPIRFTHFIGNRGWSGQKGSDIDTGIFYNISSSLQGKNYSLKFFPNSLFENLFTHIISINDFNLLVGNPNIPIKDSLLLSWKIPAGWKDKLAKIYISRGHTALDTWKEGDSVNTWIKEFATYTLNLDTIPPYLGWGLLKNGASVKSGQEMTILMGDRESGLKNYNAYLDDAWILMEYDAKSHHGFIQTPTNLTPGKHALKIKLTDKSGNILEEKLFIYF